MEHKLFPYPFRKGQEDIVKHISDTVERSSHLVMESGTGSGKTVCALAPTLDYALKHEKRVLYLTRTNSQQRQVIFELRKINAKQKIYGAGVQGRNQMCPAMEQDELLAKGSSEELSKVCGKRKMEVLAAISKGAAPKSCTYFARVCTKDLSALREWAQDTLPTVEELAARCKEESCCPYELNKSLILEATLVTAPYIYFFNPFIRTRLLEWMGCNLEDIILIIDEAHNLPNYARDIESAELSLRSLELAKKEAMEFGNLRTSDGLIIGDLMDSINSIIENLKKEYMGKNDDDSMLPPGEFSGELMHAYKTTSRKLKAVANDLIIHGEIIKDVRLKDGKLPRSYINSVGHFLMLWLELADEDFIKLISGPVKTRLEIFCLEPVHATKPIIECHSSIHMSGTLTPLEEYRDTIGLSEETVLASFPPPFPKENRLVLYVEDVTTRYEDLARDKNIAMRMENHITGISGAFKRNTAFFFPSFRLLNNFREKGIDVCNEKNCYVEEQGMSQSEVMRVVEDFKSQSGSVLMSVVGGRLSEGMDYPAEEMEILVIVGIPYPKPTAKQRALELFYDRKFGKGWDYAVKAPTTRRLLQTIGRLIRDEKDRGVAVILDKRATHFRSYIPELKISFQPVMDCRKFFGE
jgi:DNA excision repair protein ERCC-2